MPPINAKKNPKPTETSAASASGRPVIHPFIQVKAYLGENALTAAKAKELLGWEELEAGPSIPDGLKTLGGKHVRCVNNSHNRPFTPAWAETLGQDILNRNWADARNGGTCEVTYGGTEPIEGPDGTVYQPGDTLTIPDLSVNGETIILSRSAEVHSAQHRLAGLIWADSVWDGPQSEHWRKVWPERPSIEAIVVVGVSDHPHVTRTLDNVRPRDIGDVLLTDTALFGRKSASDRRVLTRMLGNAIKMLWGRTQAKADPFNPHLSNSEACDFVERHSKLKACVAHIHTEYSANWKACSNRLSAGYAAGFLYLMSASDSDPVKYRDRGRKESALDLGHYEQASEFWTLLCAGSPDLEPVRQALSWLYGPDGHGNPSQSEKAAVIVKAWNEFRAGKDGAMTLANLKPRYGPPNEDGDCKLLERPKVGGIDLGDAVEADDADEPDAPTEEQVEQAKEETKGAKEKPEKKGTADKVAEIASQNRKVISGVRERNPDLLLLFKGKEFSRAWDDDADAVGQELGLVVSQVDGMMCCAFPTKDLDVNLAKLLAANLRVGVCTSTGKGVNDVACEEVKVATPAADETKAVEPEPVANGKKKGSPRKAAAAK